MDPLVLVSLPPSHSLAKMIINTKITTRPPIMRRMPPPAVVVAVVVVRLAPLDLSVGLLHS